MILDKPFWKAQDLDDMQHFPSSPCQKRKAIAAVFGALCSAVMFAKAQEQAVPASRFRQLDGS